MEITLKQAINSWHSMWILEVGLQFYCAFQVKVLLVKLMMISGSTTINYT